MVFSKDPAKVQARQEQKARREEDRRRQQEEQARVAHEQAFAASPPGQARAARAAGLPVFQTVLPIASTPTAVFMPMADPRTVRWEQAETSTVLAAIENEGWSLVQMATAFRPMGSTSRDKLLSTGQNEQVFGELLGVYVFRPKDPQA